MQRSDLVDFLDSYLNIHTIKDYGPQGLQVEGRAEVQRVVATVDAQLACAQAAVAHGGDLLLVHHGIFWGPARALRGGYGALVRYYFEQDLNLYAAHLALDAHPQVGNNAELTRLLGLEVVDWWAQSQGTKLGAVAISEGVVTFAEICNRFAQRVGPPVLAQPFGPQRCGKIAILSGSGTGYFDEAVAMGCDTIVTGETSHAHFYDAQTLGVNVLYGGHYATETVGVKALGALVAARFGVEFTYVDIPTGM